jgi:hypothetical protein
MIDFNEALKLFWQIHGFDVVYQPNCLKIPPEDDGVWKIQFPEVRWNQRSIVLMHCQDFLNINENGVRELQIIEKYFGDKSRRVVVVVWNVGLIRQYQGPLNLCYFPSHSYNIIVNLLQHKSQWHPSTLNEHRSTVFQCLNGATRPHRCRLVQLLDQFPSKVISLGDDVALPSWPYSTYRGTENEDNFLRLLPVYSDCSINIVSETQYDYSPGIITEKTVFALLSRQIPMLIGYRGIVADLVGLGFDVFDDVIDVGYDSADNDSRIEQAIESNSVILTQGISQDIIADRLDANQNKVMTWPERMIQSYQKQCQNIMSSIL